VPFLARVTKDDLAALTALVADRRVTPVIDRTYPLDETPAAIAYVETKRVRGKVVISLQSFS
jgi:NADPH:quinone reductase-like Zn-dependent oxidoreductase